MYCKVWDNHCISYILQYMGISSQVVPLLTLVVATLVQSSSSASTLLLKDIADVVKSLTPDMGQLGPDLLQCVSCHPAVSNFWPPPPRTSASFSFSSTGAPAVAGSNALTLAPGIALGIFKGLLIGNHYLELI